VGAVLEGLSAHGLVIELKGEGSGTLKRIQAPELLEGFSDGSGSYIVAGHGVYDGDLRKPKIDAVSFHLSRVIRAAMCA
jgi:hypothetical protein